MITFWITSNDSKKIIEFSEIKNKISEIFFIQLICLDDFRNNKIKALLKDEIKVKKFIQEKIIQL